MNPERLLVLVEDDEAFARTLKRSFERRGYAVLTADNHAALVALLKTHRPTHAVVDLKLGPESGLVCVQTLHAHDPAMLIVVLQTREPAPGWPSHVAASVSTVAALDTITRPLLEAIAPAVRQEFTSLLADADASLREIETLRSDAVDSMLLAEVYQHALDSKQRLLEGIRDYHHEGE